MEMRIWTLVRVSMAAMSSAVAACGGDSSSSPDWPGVVEAEVDDLTGERTGLFRTIGPTSLIVAGPDTVPVTVGYWCQVDEVEGEPLTAIDGMFLKILLPDTSLTSSGAEAFGELRGTLGLLDLARMAVDGRVSAWRYDPKPELGAWYLDGAMGFVPVEEFDSSEEREAFVSVLASRYELLGALATVRPSSRVSNSFAEADVAELRATWSLATDYVASHYFGRDTLGVELKQVVKYPLDGFEAAADSVRFWCPVPQSHHEWNGVRRAFFSRIDSLQAGSAAMMLSLREERARRDAIARAAQARARAAVEDSIRTAQARARAAVEDSIRAEQIRQAEEEDSIRALGLRTYRVRSGDSLWGIARAHGVTVDRLVSFNSLRSQRLYAGQVLRIPPKR